MVLPLGALLQCRGGGGGGALTSAEIARVDASACSGLARDGASRRCMNYALLPPTAHCAVADRVECEFSGGVRHGCASVLAFDGGGCYLASGHGDGSLFIWDLCLRGDASLPARAEAAAHAGAVEAVAWSSRDDVVATCGGDGCVTCWAFRRSGHASAPGQHKWCRTVSHFREALRISRLSVAHTQFHKLIWFGPR